MAEFKVKSRDVDSIVGKPTFHDCCLIRLGVEENCMAVKDRRDNKYGKLHLIRNTSILPGGPDNELPRLTDRGIPAYPDENWYNRQDYATEWVNDQEAFLNDENFDAACCQFILDNVEEVYLASLKDPHVGFKSVTCREMIDYLVQQYPASEEAKDIQRAILNEL